jgi:hypothetical protein
MVAWISLAVRAKKGYLAGFRRSIDRREVAAEEVRLSVADLSTVETLIEELAHPDEQQVLYAMDVLESLDKRNLITPLLLSHESPAVRARALLALGAARPEVAERWRSAVERLVKDPMRRYARPPSRRLSPFIASRRPISFVRTCTIPTRELRRPLRPRWRAAAMTATSPPQRRRWPR